MAAKRGGAGNAPRSSAAERNRRARLRSQYGISAEQYERLFRDQQGRCYICDRPPKNVRLSIDHDHVTGFVRGLLCQRCNRAIAAFNDSRGLLNMAAQYLADSEDWWDSLTEAEQLEWLPFRGRTTGKLRRKRIAKARPRPRLPQTESDSDIL